MIVQGTCCEPDRAPKNELRQKDELVLCNGGTLARVDCNAAGIFRVRGQDLCGQQIVVHTSDHDPSQTSGVASDHALAAVDSRRLWTASAGADHRATGPG